MPKPLSTIHRNADVKVSAGALIAKPEFALMAMRVISIWAHIDGDLATIFSLLLKSDITTGVAMYESLGSADAKRRMLTAAAKESLPPWKFLILQAVLDISKASKKKRNDFAHGVWGYADVVPEALILMPSSVVTRFNVSRRQTYKVEGSNVIRPEDMDASKMMVHYEMDFDDAVVEATDLSIVYIYLYWTIYGAPEIGRRWLLAHPKIQDALRNKIDRCDPLTREILRPPVGGEPPPIGTHD